MGAIASTFRTEARRLCLLRLAKIDAARAGVIVMALTAEIIIDTAIVRANWRKNCPVMPEMKAHGTNTALSTRPIAMTGPATCDIVAAVASKFVCIADEAKLKDVLGAFPLPVEVIPMARSYVARELVRLGGHPELRQGFTTDNGNIILDVRGLAIVNPVALEGEINQIVGVVANGLFARRGADVLLLGGSKSPAYLKAALDALERVLPHARRVEFPGLGHEASGNSDRRGQPERVAQELRRFFVERQNFW